MPVVFLTSGTTSWQVPAGISILKIECLGSGGSSISTNRSGGAGGAYSADPAVAVTPGETLTVQVPLTNNGAIGAGGNGADCFVKRGSTALVLAKSASGPSAATVVAIGGQASAGVGVVKYSGGNAGADASISGRRTGGGGAAGPSGDGARGASTSSLAGSGGGGANGGGIPPTPVAGGGVGGTGPTGAAGGTGGGGAGANGSGGGGSTSTANSNAGANSHNAEWGGIYGCGSGGGSTYSGTGIPGTGSNGFGGGAGGHLQTGFTALGGDGLIVITYATSVYGLASLSEQNDTLSAASALRISGALTAAEQDDILSSVSANALAGSAVLIEQDDTLSASSSQPIFGASAVTETNDTLTSAGQLRIFGQAAITEAADTVTGTNLLAGLGGGSTKNSGTAASIAIPAPVAVEIGNVLSLWLHSDTTATAATFTATGWTPTFATITSNPGAAGNSARHYTKIADASDVILSQNAGSYTFGRSGGSGTWGGIIDRLFGIDSANPIDVSASLSSANSEGSSPSVTTTGAGRIIMHYTTWDEGKGFVAAPSGDTLVATNIQASNAAASAYRVQAAAGASVAGLWDLSTLTRVCVATVAFKPASGSQASGAGVSDGVATASAVATAVIAASAASAAQGGVQGYGTAIQGAASAVDSSAQAQGQGGCINPATTTVAGAGAAQGRVAVVVSALGTISGASTAQAAAASPAIANGGAYGGASAIGNAQAIIPTSGGANGTVVAVAEGEKVLPFTRAALRHTAFVTHNRSVIIERHAHTGRVKRYAVTAVVGR